MSDDTSRTASSDPDPPAKTRVERLNARIRENPLVAAAIVVGTIVIAVASFTDATTKLVAAFSRPSPAAARASLGQMNVPFTGDAFVASAAAGDAVAVKLFLVAGMDPNTVSARDGSALGNAARAGRANVVEALLAGGARIEPLEGRPSALASAVSGGHNDIVRTMLARHPDAATLDEAFVAATTRATAQTTRNDEGMRLLAASGANVKKVAATTLAAGIEGCCTEEDATATTRTLIELGADLGGVPGADGATVAALTPLMAASSRGYLSTVQLLLTQKVPVDLRLDHDAFDGPGLTALMMAVRASRADVAAALIAAKADIERKNGNGDDLLLIAAKQADAATFQVVLAHAVDVEATDRAGATALHALAGNTRYPNGDEVAQAAAVVALLDRGADIDARDAGGRTALMLAAAGGVEPVVRVLMARGARSEDRDAAGLRAIDWARKGSDPARGREVIRLLQSRRR